MNPIDAAKAELRAATKARAEDFDRLMQAARAGISEVLEQVHGKRLRDAEARLDAAVREARGGRHVAA